MKLFHPHRSRRSPQSPCALQRALMFFFATVLSASFVYSLNSTTSLGGGVDAVVNQEARLLTPKVIKREKDEKREKKRAKKLDKKLDKKSAMPPPVLETFTRTEFFIATCDTAEQGCNAANLGAANLKAFEDALCAAGTNANAVCPVNGVEVDFFIDVVPFPTRTVNQFSVTATFDSTGEFSTNDAASKGNAAVADGTISNAVAQTVTGYTVKISPTASPTKGPTKELTASPTASPTKGPTKEQTASPTASPTKGPTKEPTGSPTASPTKEPTKEPTASPTASPTKEPTKEPTGSPTASPTKEPTKEPTGSPTTSPTKEPTGSPTVSPTKEPTVSPTGFPTKAPTSSPTVSPTGFPTKAPTSSPTSSPTVSPTGFPTKAPTSSPTVSPTGYPTKAPTSSPTFSPTGSPTATPCTTSSECFSGFCAIRRLSGNVCESSCEPYGCVETAGDKTLDNGMYCERSSQCKSERCSSSGDDLKHTCESVCGEYGCEKIGIGMLKLGDTCQSSTQCKSSKCASGKCSSTCYGACPGLKSVPRTGSTSNDDCCNTGPNCQSGVCCYDLNPFGCNTCENKCGLAVLGPVAGENKSNDRYCEDNMNCRSLQCSTTAGGYHTCEDNCGQFGCEGDIIGAELPNGAVCESSNQCASLKCSETVGGRHTCEAECGLLGCRAESDVGDSCFQDSQCRTDRCAYGDHLFDWECRNKIAEGETCPLGEFGACNLDLSCMGLPGDGNALCANEDNLAMAQDLFDEVWDDATETLSDLLEYFKGLAESITPDDKLNSDIDIDNDVDISPFLNDIDKFKTTLGNTNTFRRRRQLEQRGLAIGDGFLVKIFGKCGVAFFKGYSVEVGLIIGSSEGDFTVGVYIRFQSSIGGLNYGAGCQLGLGLVFDSIENTKGRNGCVLIEAATAFGASITVCGLPAPTYGFVDGGFDPAKIDTFESGPFEATVAVVAGERISLAYIATMQYVGELKF